MKCYSILWISAIDDSITKRVVYKTVEHGATCEGGKGFLMKKLEREISLDMPQLHKNFYVSGN